MDSTLNSSLDSTEIFAEYIDHRNLEKTSEIKRRWTVFQGNVNTGIFQLKIFKNEKKKSLKSAYTINKDNFLGLERGEIRGNRNKKNSSTVYLGVILKGGITVCLQQTTEVFSADGVPAADNLERWRQAILDQFFCESWIVYPKKGLQSQEFQMTLHATSNYLSLVTLSPPRSHKVWSMENIIHCECVGDLFLFNISGQESGGSFELRADSTQEARHINQTVKRMVSSRRQEKKRSTPSLEVPPILPRRQGSEKDRYTPSPILDRKAPVFTPPREDGPGS